MQKSKNLEEVSIGEAERLKRKLSELRYVGILPTTTSNYLPVLINLINEESLKNTRKLLDDFSDNLLRVFKTTKDTRSRDFYFFVDSMPKLAEEINNSILAQHMVRWYKEKSQSIKDEYTSWLETMKGQKK